nr:MAG TPA: hypothetical protein [Caudoviricetes sp.]
MISCCHRILSIVKADNNGEYTLDGQKTTISVSVAYRQRPGVLCCIRIKAPVACISLRAAMT